MNVRELILALQNYDPDVLVAVDAYGIGYNPVTQVSMIYTTSTDISNPSVGSLEDSDEGNPTLVLKS